MLATAPRPKPQTSKGKKVPPPPSFETDQAKPQNELREMIRAIGEQVSGRPVGLPVEQGPVASPDYQIAQLRTQDEQKVKSNYSSLRERLAHVREATKHTETSKKQQEVQVKQQRAMQAQASQPAESAGKGSLKDRMFSAMGIKRGKKTASNADKSQTREIAKTPSQ